MLAFHDRVGIFLFLLVCIASAFASAVVMVASGWLIGVHLTAEDFFIWFAADGLALAIFLPIFHGLGDRHWGRLRNKYWRLGAALAAIVALSVFAAFGPPAPAVRFVVLPLFVLIAFDLGLAGVEICLGGFLLTWAMLTALGHPPGAWPQMDMRSYMLMAQTLVAAMAVTVVPLAVALEEKDRVGEALARAAKEEAAKEEADKAHAFKSRLLVSASHDLRQPLQAAKTYLSALERRLEDPELRAICTNTGQALDTMSNIMETLLDISKLEAGVIIPQRSDFQIEDLLKRVVASNAPQAQAKGLQIVLRAEPCVVRSDPNLLERVIDNFVTNAIRYTDAGAVTVWCEARTQRAVVGVSDTGVGIAPEALAEIFGDYVQLNNPERDRRKGLGLGLAIAQRMAALLGHHIEVQSTIGEGSTFSIEAPLGVIMPARALESVVRDVDLRGVRVLFIDDDPVIADAMSIVFQDAGIELRLARDGDDAAAQVAAGLRPDLIVSDFRLPGANGGEVIRRLRQMLGVRAPSVILTGDTGLQGLLKEDDCAVLHKPIDSLRLLALVRELAGGVAANAPSG
jgi:signal transduction histidine kinase